jgi:hypothetical protein
MTRQEKRHNRPVSIYLHPIVYWAIYWPCRLVCGIGMDVF